MGAEVQFRKIKEVLEMGGAYGCTKLNVFTATELYTRIWFRC